MFVDGRDVRTYEKDELHRKFGVVFQNDMVFFNTLREKHPLWPGLDDAALTRAVEDAVAAEYIDSLEEGWITGPTSRGANLSGRAAAAAADFPRPGGKPGNPHSGRFLLRSGL